MNGENLILNSVADALEEEELNLNSKVIAGNEVVGTLGVMKTGEKEKFPIKLI